MDPSQWLPLAKAEAIFCDQDILVDESHGAGSWAYFAIFD
jgi:hypothetical protein